MGAGAVGTYLGSRLAERAAEVLYAPRNYTDVVPVPDVDLAIVAVKSYDTPAAVATLERALGAGSSATILCPQNGVGNEERLAAAFGADNIVAAALTVPVDNRDGKAVASNAGGIALAPVGALAHNWLIAAFEATGIPTRTVADYRALKWSKLSLNIIANASCAILNVLPERLVHFQDVFALEIRAIRETREAMLALGLQSIDLPRYPVRALQGVVQLPVPFARMILAGRIAGARGRKPPSLLLDLRAAKGRTEVDVLNGAVAEVGRAHGIKMPVNRVFARVLEDIAHMPQLWAKYRERPSALVAEVEAEQRRLDAAPSEANAAKR